MGWWLASAAVVTLLWLWYRKTRRPPATPVAPSKRPTRRVVSKHSPRSVARDDPFLPKPPSGLTVRPSRSAPTLLVVVDPDRCKRVDSRGYIAKTHVPLRPREVAGLGNVLWQEMLDAFERRCRYCGIQLSDHPERDHRQPLAMGGRNEAANIVPACSRCNRYKSLASEVEYTSWMSELAGVSGWLPPKAQALLDRIAKSPKGREERSTTLFKEAFRGVGYWKPFDKPVTAVILDPPDLDSYSSTKGDWWADRGTPIAGISYQQTNALKLLGSEDSWGGWGYLLPEPDNAHDSDAVAVFAQARKLGYLPKGRHPRVVSAAHACWKAQELPVVRVVLWNSKHIGGRVHVHTGHVSRHF